MEICGPAVIPHSHFLGGPLVWTELDRAKQRAWHRRQKEIHPACGVHPDVWDYERGGDLGNLHLAPRHCAACEYAAAKAAEDSNKDPIPGTYQVWEFRPTEEDDPDDDAAGS